MTKLWDIEGGQDALQYIRASFPILAPGRLRDIVVMSVDASAAATPDCSQGDWFIADAGGGPMLVRAPLRSPQVAHEILFTFQNFTGAPFVVTWAAAYRVDAAWAGPGANKIKTVAFIRLGNTWLQMGPAVDV